MVQVLASLNADLENNEIFKRQAPIAVLKGNMPSDGRTCKGEIRVIENGSIEWKDGDKWSKFKDLWHYTRVPWILTL